MTIEQIVALLAALGVGGALGEAVKGLWRLFTGRQQVEQTLLQQYRADAEEYRRQRNEADAYRRIMAEHASELRRILLNAGYPGPLPDFPLPQPSPPVSASQRKHWGPLSAKSPGTAGSVLEPPNKYS